MDKFRTFYAHLEFIKSIWYSLRSFGTFVVIWYILWHFVSRKIWQPWVRRFKFFLVRSKSAKVHDTCVSECDKNVFWHRDGSSSRTGH
jgi:hypothetical protein